MGRVTVGLLFGQWKVEAFAYFITYGSKRKPLWFCRCSCLNRTRRPVLQESLLSGKSKNCGCVRRVKLSEPRSVLTFRGISISYPDAAELCGLTERQVANRLSRGDTLDRLVMRNPRESRRLRITFKDLPSKVGSWELLGEHRNEKGTLLVHCRCECGTHRNVQFNSLKIGTSTKCNARCKGVRVISVGSSTKRAVSPI